MNNILLGIVIGITLSTLNVVVLINKNTQQVSKKIVSKVKRFFYKKATIVDLSPEVDLDGQLEKDEKNN